MWRAMLRPEVVGCPSVSAPRSFAERGRVAAGVSSRYDSDTLLDMTPVARSWLLALCAYGALAASGGGRGTPAPVQVRQCCGEKQTVRPAESPAGWKCEPDEVEGDSWKAKVYAPARRSFLAPGVLPAHWSVRQDRTPDCDSPTLLEDDDTVPYFVFANNGSLLVRRSGQQLPPAEWCLSRSAALLCRRPLAHPAPKCCPASEAYSSEAARCRPSEWGAATADGLRALAGAAADGGLGGGWPSCADGRYAVVGELTGAELEDGALRLAGAELAAGSWCAEFVLERNETAVLACGGRAAAGRHVWYGAGLAVGAAFLGATLLASRLLPAQHHALHGRCQTRYVATLMLGDALLAATQLAGDSVPPLPCKLIAVAMHFLFLSAFFWLNTMCFNIWWTFRDFRPTSLERGQEARRLRLYRAYAWGAPLLLAGTAAAMDWVPGARGLRPRFAERRCWFRGDAELLAYFFGPVGALLLVNLLLFVSTARALTCGLWRRDELKASSERAALGRVCAKLLVVMGVSWGADVVSWAAGGPHALWYATDLLNALQGVLVFCVVGCRAAVLSAARRALPWPRPERSCQDSLTHTTAAPAPAPAPAETVC